MFVLYKKTKQIKIKQYLHFLSSTGFLPWWEKTASWKLKPEEMEIRHYLLTVRWLKQAVRAEHFFFLKSVQAWSEAQPENMLKTAKQARQQLKLSAKIQYNSNCPELNVWHAAGQTAQTTDTSWPWIFDYLVEKIKGVVST